MATIYSGASSDGFRCACTYSLSSDSTQVTISGTIYLQHKGSAYSSPYVPVCAEISYAGLITDVVIADTNTITSCSAHSNWTSINSKAFSNSFDKKTYTRQQQLSIGPSVHFMDPETTFEIEIPSLDYWAVVYNTTGGTNKPDNQVKYYGIDLTLRSSKPTKTDYVFSHWNTEIDNTGTTYIPGATYSANADLNLYAIWNSTVKYNANGGNTNIQTQNKIYGTPLTLSSSIPTRTGYVFDKWNTAADGSGDDYASGATYSEEVSVTLYAQWKSLPSKPIITSMSAIRWDETEDEQADEGTSAKITAEWSIDLSSDYYGSTNTATVTCAVTPQSGSSLPTITPVSGTSGTSGTAIFMASNLDTDMQYTVTVTVTDRYSFTNKVVILTRAYFTMDFKAGGGGIGIGRAAPDSGLEIGYETIFDQDVTVYEDLIVSGNVVSPKMTGIPTAPTPSSGDDSTKVATTAFVKNAIGGGGSSHGIPSGGSDGQILTKQSGTDYDVDWEEPPSVASTDVPTADTIAEFDSDAHMNSTDMTTGVGGEVESFVDGLNVTGFDLVEDISNKFTFTSAWTGLVRSAYKIGKLVVFSLGGNAGTVVAGTQYIMVTIASGYRPKTTTYYTGHGTNGSYLPQGIVNSIAWTSGDITVRPQTNTCNYIFVSGVYVLP